MKCYWRYGIKGFRDSGRVTLGPWNPGILEPFNRALQNAEMKE